MNAWQWICGLIEFAAAAYLTDWILFARPRRPQQRERNHRSDHSAEWPIGEPIWLGQHIRAIQQHTLETTRDEVRHRLRNAYAIPPATTGDTTELRIWGQADAIQRRIRKEH